MTDLRNIFTPIGYHRGLRVFITEMSTWSGNGSPSPISGQSLEKLPLTQVGKGDERYWELEADGVLLRIFND